MELLRLGICWYFLKTHRVDTHTHTLWLLKINQMRAWHSPHKSWKVYLIFETRLCTLNIFVHIFLRRIMALFISLGLNLTVRWLFICSLLFESELDTTTCLILQPRLSVNRRFWMLFTFKQKEGFKHCAQQSKKKIAHKVGISTNKYIPHVNCWESWGLGQGGGKEL